jgi:hypothetical protein
MAFDDLLALVLRWAHILSAVVLLGGVIYARWVQLGMSDEAAARFRGLAITTIALLALSGIYNLLNKPRTPSPYHAIFGIKVLLALHVFAVAILLGKAGASSDKRLRWMSGIAISGIVIVLLSGYLRWLSS